MLNPSIAIHSLGDDIRAVCARAEAEIKQITGSAVRVVAYYNAVEKFASSEDKEKSRAGNIEILKQCICDYHGMNWESVTKRRRLSRYVVPRITFMHIAKNIMAMTYEDIGSVLGFDHSTVVHWVNRIKDYFETGDARAQAIRDVEEMYLGRVKAGGYG